MNNKFSNSAFHQAGFTLVELIVALALGLLITAAATQLFLGGIVTTRIQQANAELQDSGVFGLDYIARDIRLANYGNISNPELTNTTPQGGIVLSQGASGTVNVSKDIGNNSVTRSGLTSNVSDASDQLTIQFTAPNDMFNCEGEEIKTGEYVIQRYFLRKDTNGGEKDLVLACDANKKGAMSAANITDFGGTQLGEVIMPRVDHLRFYLGAMTKSGATVTSTAYYTISEYISAANAARNAGQPVPRITSIKAAVIVRSIDNTNNQLIDPTKSILFLEKSVTLTNQTKHLRRTYMTTIAIRNGMGDAI
ncbi:MULTISPECIES: PilW family protein [unclassified Acinetobacter]|uniref:PilW family protein n=1 Tax=unclassified Acinetobacter TaxID=196816 RepID=UPI0028829944|nr:MULTISPECIES: PilW family protein [unclassified Acinetobacter]MDT0198387.1 PilW family protein [Acinetobacter sp. RG5]MDT0229839.1 PilW family protein [Acinetobacter sp. RRD8]